MKLKVTIFILILLFSNMQKVASAEENEYGIAKVWFNERNATVETIEGVKLKINEPFDVRVEIESKINGHVTLILQEPGITKAFEVLSGPSKLDQKISNLNIESGWSKIYRWKLTPSGAWKNGNAPINLLVKFYNIKSKKDKIMQFTIANPYILDEQYSGAVPTPEKTVSPVGTQAKETPFLPVIFTVGTLIIAWRWRRGKS